MTRLGFRRYRLFEHLTERSLLAAIPAPALPEGFTIRAATMDDAERLAAVRNSAFDAGRSAAAFREEVMRKPGYHPERELLVVAPGGQVAAFTVTWLDELNKVGHFEPVGTHRGFRRRGLAGRCCSTAFGSCDAWAWRRRRCSTTPPTWRRATSTAASASSGGTRPSGSGAPIDRRPGPSARRPRRPSLSQYER